MIGVHQLKILLQVVLLLVVISGLINFTSWLLSDDQDGNSSSLQQTNTKKLEEDNLAKLVEELAPEYCKNFVGYRLDVEEFLSNKYKNNGKGKYKEDECKKILSKIVNDGTSSDNLRSIAEGKISIGMRGAELLASWGFPNDSNSTTSFYGSSFQLIYGDPLYGANYVYVDNGRVTTIQQ